MLDEILDKMNGEVHKLAMLFSVSSQVLRTFEQEFKEDKEGKGKAIDSLILALQKAKENL